MSNSEQAKIISLLALAVALVHLAVPQVKLDPVTLVLLVVAAIPWLAPYLKSIQVEGLKIDFRELQKVEREAASAGLVETVRQGEPPAYVSVSDEDPNLALAGLRIEIEKRLKAIAQGQGIDSERAGIGRLLRLLRKNRSLSDQECSVLAELASLLNRAVHGAEVDTRSAEWALDVGAGILAALDQRTARME